MSNREEVDSSAILAAAARLQRANLLYPTPLDENEALSAQSGAAIFQKLELFQRTGSFKLRGAANKLLSLPHEMQQIGVVTASAGNHAQGIAYAARALGIKATIVVPNNASSAKVAALQRYPIELIQIGNGYAEAEQHARQLEQTRGLVFVSAYNDLEVIAGQGTIGLEVLAALPDADALLVPVGGGGLISGIALWAKTVKPTIKVIGVQSEASPFMHAALAAGQLVDAPDLPSLADGLAGAIEPGSITFALTQRYVDDVLVVTEADIATAMNYYLTEQHLVVEGSGAVGLAALLSGKFRPTSLASRHPKIVDIVSGRNVAASTLQTVFQANQ